MPNEPYTLDSLFDPTSVYFNGALRLSTPPGAKSTFADALNPATLNAGELQGNTILEDGYIKSSNYVAGVSGWYLDPTTGEFNFAVSVDSLDIPDTVTANSFHVDIDGNTWWGATTFGAAVASISKAGAAIFNSVTIAGYLLASKGSFGGDGADGALTITSGTTTISVASARSLVKNYSSVSITGTGVLAFSTPHASGSVVIVKSQGAMTLTSSATPMVDCSAMGSAGGVSAATSNPGVNTGGTGTTGAGYDYITNGGVGGNTAGGAGGAAMTSAITYQTFSADLEKYRKILMGTGGGGGGNTGGSGAGVNVGGVGGGVLIIECAGAWNFTTALGISVKGGNALQATTSGSTRVGGGGGGSGGFCFVMYNTLTVNSGTINTAGGTGGFNDASGDNATTRGGGGGGGYLVAGSNGTASATSIPDTQTGGNGAVGYSLVAQNTIYA